jgi:deoxyadenosine/deoxycytidine kinase
VNQVLTQTTPSLEDTPGYITRKVTLAQERQVLPRHIAVEGPIGVGKTTLARRLAAALRYPIMLEPVTENPFLDRFYREGSVHALPTQLFFLLHRARQMADMPTQDLLGPTLVADFIMEKDRLFAQLTLDAAEFALYEQIHASLKIDPPTPDLVIYLQAPAEVLWQRVHGRGIDFEQHIETDYLRDLADCYTEFFHYYEAAPLLVVNASEIDFAHNDDHFAALLDQIINMEGSRQFFNPNPTLL